MANRIKVEFEEDSSNTLLARVAGLNGTGDSTGKDGEGKFHRQADFSSIERKVFDLDGDTPDTPADETTLTVSDVILDTPVNDNVWNRDDIGYNFKNVLPPALIPVGNHVYSVQYKFTLTGGYVFYTTFEGRAKKVKGD